MNTNKPINRRQCLALTGVALTGAFAGCLSDAEESGTVRGTDGVTHNFELDDGDELRIEVDNEEGLGTFVDVLGPNDEIVAEGHVETEGEITHTAEISGIYSTHISPDGTASYEIFIED